MIEKVLSGIGGIGVYGVISVLLFFAVFLGALLWVFGLRRSYLDHMSQLPLESDAPSPPDAVVNANPDSRHD